jgi:nicotinate-nucleotide pyrophosphorylase (carboxylating)
VGPRAKGPSTSQLRALARRALAEDRAGHDRTSRSVLGGRREVRARVVAQAPGVLSGLSAAQAVAAVAGLRARARRRDGDTVERGTVVLELRGDARQLFAAERTILNLLMHASGVATATARAVAAVRGAHPRLEVRATRKTLPLLRDLEKAAVVHGGGHPHRRDLSEALLIKSNHLALVPLATAIARARADARPGEAVEVEVRGPREALRAARAGATSLLVDNASPRAARAVVRTLTRGGVRPAVWVELSGGITPENVRRYRGVGADAVSLGALTHSARAVPFHLTDVRPA